MVALSETMIGWLLVAAGVLTVLIGVASRVFIGRRRETSAIRGMVHTFRKTGVARVLFGRFDSDVLDDDELDAMILMPTIVVACGLCLTAVFLLGYQKLV
ncbi:hypothetical protein [Mycobacterium sp. E740]|uniref:hypothetical protein n=1 Tax=Mycobacterium sp. E740 TaxID=1834149 RepID=UPI0007FBE40E|nr:hypothetical protein [Mycobacterium sp. E740]OBI80752.1 hypothetical protein A5663_17350 [Mycobacterium sp. E740]